MAGIRGWEEEPNIFPFCVGSPCLLYLPMISYVGATGRRAHPGGSTACSLLGLLPTTYLPTYHHLPVPSLTSSPCLPTYLFVLPVPLCYILYMVYHPSWTCSSLGLPIFPSTDRTGQTDVYTIDRLQARADCRTHGRTTPLLDHLVLCLFERRWKSFGIALPMSMPWDFAHYLYVSSLRLPCLRVSRIFSAPSGHFRIVPTSTFYGIMGW